MEGDGCLLLAAKAVFKIQLLHEKCARQPTKNPLRLGVTDFLQERQESVWD
jgi:hypothetical protein